MKINDYTELAIAICNKDDFTLAVKAIYKGTNCGASLQKIDNGVKIGSIVEGCAAETQYYDFVFPIDMCAFWATMTEIERQAVEIWNDNVSDEHKMVSPDGENS